MDVPVVHGVESGDLIDAHRGDLDHLGDGVHDRQAGPAKLTLAKVQKRHDGSLLVLGRVLGHDLLCTLHVFGGKLKLDVGIVVRGVAVLLQCGNDGSFVSLNAVDEKEKEIQVHGQGWVK